LLDTAAIPIVLSHAGPHLLACLLQAAGDFQLVGSEHAALFDDGTSINDGDFRTLWTCSEI
jgi:hypothetical protein